MFTDIKQYAALQQTNEGYYFDQETGILKGPKIGSRAVWKPIPENDTQPRIKPKSVIVHTNAGNNPAKWWQLWGWVNNASVTGEPHFDVDNDGIMGQFMSVFRRADCNYSANRWLGPDGDYYGAISIETGDMGTATVESTPWNLDQLAGIIAIATACSTQFGTGCNEATAWNSKGLDYHTKFPYQGIGRPAWTNSYGKTCPGKARKSQMFFIRQSVSDRVVAYINKCKEFGVPHGIPGL